METESTESVLVDNETVFVSSLKIESAQLARMLSNVEDRAAVLKDLVELGLRARNLADNRVDEDSVRLTVTKLSENFENSVNTAINSIDETTRQLLVGEDSEVANFLKTFRDNLQNELNRNFDAEQTNSFMSKFNTLLNITLDSEISNLRRQFEVTNPDSALGVLNAALKQSIKEAHDSFQEELELIKGLITKESTKKTERGKQSVKGLDLEKAILEALSPYCTNQHDTISHTGETIGFSGNKKGDLVILVNDRNQADFNIVIESKATGKTTSAIREEMMLAMENRRAEVGIAVFDSEKAPTGIVDSFTPFDNFCVVLVDRDEVDPEKLYFAYLWAKWTFTRHQFLGEGEVSISKVKDFLTKVQT